MLGRLALWKGALLVSRTQAFVTGEGGLCCFSVVIWACRRGAWITASWVGRNDVGVAVTRRWRSYREHHCLPQDPTHTSLRGGIGGGSPLAL